MRYKLTCLTPTLVGDGQKLSPIDYMVWKDHVNVLDQRRIFKLLAKGPRLDGYLAQLRKAEKLDFASWGGFAQNFAGRRIPFEHPSLAALWDKQRADALFIPTFAAGVGGPFLPASALKGVLHTGVLYSRWSDSAWKQVQERCQGDRLPRRPAEAAEDMAIGLEGHSRMRALALADSAPVPSSSMKVYLLRTAALVPRGAGKQELGWKQTGRGSVDSRRIEEATPYFCEMAAPGTSFEGLWSERQTLRKPEVTRILRWRESLDTKAILAGANAFAARLIDLHAAYAAAAGMKSLEDSIASLKSRLERAIQSETSALVCIGWGGGFLSKVSQTDTEQEGLRRILRQLPLYSRAIQTGLPFPKTRRVVFLNGQPAALPGWALLEVA
ncbi:MAG: hypothetical protein HY820_08945 [Acidobacteria bacterium]|nr:hypothetical protein [Acidobacteriota bacterium]